MTLNNNVIVAGDDDAVRTRGADLAVVYLFIYCDVRLYELAKKLKRICLAVIVCIQKRTWFLLKFDLCMHAVENFEIENQ